MNCWWNIHGHIMVSLSYHWDIFVDYWWSDEVTLWSHQPNIGTDWVILLGWVEEIRDLELSSFFFAGSKRVSKPLVVVVISIFRLMYMNLDFYMLFVFRQWQLHDATWNLKEPNKTYVSPGWCRTPTYWLLGWIPGMISGLVQVWWYKYIYIYK